MTGPDDTAATPELRTERTRVTTIDELVDEAGQRFDIGEHRIAVVRVGDDVRVIGDRCSHANYSLAEGEVDCDAMTLECFKHGALFSLETGVPETLPAIRPVPVYASEVVDGEVFVMLPVEEEQ